MHTALALKQICCFCYKFSSFVHDNLCWPWTLSKPTYLQVVGLAISVLAHDFVTFKESCCWVCHCQAIMQLKGGVLFRFLFVLHSEVVRTNQIHTQSVPGNDFWCWLWWKKSMLLGILLAQLAIGTHINDALHCWA